MVRMRFGFLRATPSNDSASWKPPCTRSTPALDHSGSVSSNSQWLTRLRQAPLVMTRSGDGVNLVSSRPDFSSCSTIFLTFWLWLTGATKVASEVDTIATFFMPIADSSRPSLRRYEFSQSMATTSPTMTLPALSVGLMSSSDCQEPRSFQRKPALVMAMPLARSMTA